MRHLFTSIIIVLGGWGNWGSWSSWSACYLLDGSEYKKERLRQCDNPPPNNSGAECSGESMQVEDCPPRSGMSYILSDISCLAFQHLLILISNNYF